MSNSEKTLLSSADTSKAALDARHQGQRVGGFRPWLLQRLTGLLLLALLAAHIWVNHFAGIGKVASGQQEELVLFSLSAQRLKTVLFIAIDFALLATVLHHGLSGMRTILAEWRVTARHMRTVTLLLRLLSATAFAYGAWVLVVFILG
ncbi:MAG: hypothetical protein HY683_01565 [Chloroflexi bacterium]|nr:hypothetical protein [Chloroflexota bacterium]